MTLQNFRTVSIDDIFTISEPRMDLYVYSTQFNPDGATQGTDARYIGTADSYGTARDLWEAAYATARVIGGHEATLNIGLCIDADAYLKIACEQMLKIQDFRKDAYSPELLERWEALAIEQVRTALKVAA